MPEQPKESKLKPAVSFYHPPINKYRIITITMFQEDGKNEGTCRQAKRQKQTSLDILWQRTDNYLPSGWTEWWAWTTECPGKTSLKECLASWGIENGRGYLPVHVLLNKSLFSSTP